MERRNLLIVRSIYTYIKTRELVTIGRCWKS